MINWTKLIKNDRRAVVNFAKGHISAADFQDAFKGQGSNPARCVVKNYGSMYGRRLARKALRRRSLMN